MIAKESIILRKSVNKKLGGKIPMLLKGALEFMAAKYPAVNFEGIQYIFSGSSRRSRYYRNAKNAKHAQPTVCICTRARLLLYDKKSLKMSIRDLFVGAETQIMCALVHELTHHMQYEMNLPKGELETTRNELEYLKEYSVNHYNKVMGI